jgi:hypothetical protein
MQAAPQAHPLAISTPFSSASLHQFEAGLRRLGMSEYFEPLVKGAIFGGVSLEDALFRIREDMLAPG